ncbi:MAG TPA: hypothetical protein VIM29_07995 [Bacillota bacterium]
MKRIFSTLLIIIIVLSVLGGKIYLEQLQRPHFYLLQSGKALAQRDLNRLLQWVDLDSIARNLVEDFFKDVVIKLDSKAVNALKTELMKALKEQIETYVMTGQFKRAVLMDLSKEARAILPELNITEKEAGRFTKLAYLKEKGQTALAGFTDGVERADQIVLELELKKVFKGWRIVKINQFRELKLKLKREQQQKNVRIEDLLVQGMKNTVLWGKFDREDVFLELTPNNTVDNWPTSLLISMDQGHKLRLELLSGAGNIPLPVDPGEAEAFNASGQFNEHYYIQAGEYDFNRDGRPEIVVAIGDNHIDLVVNVFKFNPAPKDSSPATVQQWKLAGVFMGQNKAYLNGNKIRLPYTAVKIELNYQWDRDGFKEVN